MCLIVLGWDIHPKFQLVLAANRDEFYDRPSEKLHRWGTTPDIIAGRDLQAGGTWMGASTRGKLAAITNFRDPKNIRSNAPSRGEIPTDFLLGDFSGEQFLHHLNKTAKNYNGFNLLALDGIGLFHFNNQEGKVNKLSKGIHALSNATLNTPWPKVLRAKEKLGAVINKDFDHQALLGMMDDTQTASERSLPDTGVSPELEKALSAMCIRTEKYGTCCTTVMTIDHSGEVCITEQSYPVGNRKREVVNYKFQRSI